MGKSEICAKENIFFRPETSTSEGVLLIRTVLVFQYLCSTLLHSVGAGEGGESKGGGRGSRTCISEDVSYMIFLP